LHDMHIDWAGIFTNVGTVHVKYPAHCPSLKTMIVHRQKIEFTITLFTGQAF